MNRNNRKNREELKKYFKKGAVPTEEQFAGLIDSVANLVEDGQIMKTATGWAFCPEQGERLDIGLYTVEPTDDTAKPAWTISVTPDGKLIISNEIGEAVMEAAQDKSTILHGCLTVDDEVTAPAYLVTGGGGGATPGGEDYLVVPADKQWHNLPIEASDEGFGSRVYHIYASFRERGTGLCQLTRATALWLNFMEQRIESPQKHWWGWSGGVRLRWQEADGKPCLQLRSKKRLPSGEIQCRIAEMYRG